ncbi:MAG: DUF4426 domain-containing protein [Pseudomonadota bacterium]
MARLLLLFAALWLATPALAEQAVTVGPWTLHYNALSTAGLDRTVATTYGITRSKNRAMLNIAVLQNLDGELPLPVRATIDASATNLTGQRRDITMRLVEEQAAIYYLGFVRVDHRETLSFAVSVTPEGADAPIEIRFEQQFFAD